MIDPTTYAEIHYKAAYDYADQVAEKRIIANRWIRLAVKRFRKDLKRKVFTLDPERVKLVMKFFSLLNIQRKGEYSQFSLHPYQAFIILNLFLFYYRKTGRRRFTSMFLFIARKNGKTVFAVALNLYFLVLDGVVDPQSLLIASTREQATIALDYAKGILNNSPAIQSRLRAMQYEIRFKDRNSVGFMKPVPAIDPDRLDGYSPSSAILDEVHAYRDAKRYEVVTSGQGARLDPITLMITTAGTLVDSFCNVMVENCKSILRGEAKDDSMFTLLYTLDEDDDYNDRSLWIKANPSEGEIVTLDYLEQEYQKTINIPSLLPNFLTKHLNIFTGGSEVWIAEEKLSRANVPYFITRTPKQDIYLGLDLSSTRDLTSLVGILEEDRKFDAIPWFWLPNNSEMLFRKGGVNLMNWIREGYITHCQTETIDYDMIYDKIIEIDQEYNIVALGYDPFNSDLILPRLIDYGINTYKFPQTASAFNFPLKYLEKMILERQMSFGKNPVLLWNFRNVVLYIDGNNNIKIMKNKSRDSVDGAVSLGMALGGWLAYNLDPEKANIAAYMAAQQTKE
jgi:phage terminase large subunit-like protein